MAATFPEFWLIAGPNGAGKTTFTQHKPLDDLLSHARLLNADDLTLKLLKSQGYSSFEEPDGSVLQETFVTAADQTIVDLEASLSANEPVVVETVLSTNKYKPFVEAVTNADGFFGLIYVALRSAELACDRVRRRHASGGHDVPAEKIRSRWKRSLEMLPWFAERADLMLVYDNSNEDPEQAPRLLAAGHRGRIVIHEEAAIPEVTEALRRVPSL